MKAKYVGAGEFHHGVPARDLNESDWELLSETQKELVVASPLYQVGPPPPSQRTLPGIGAEIAEALIHAGYKSVKAVAAASDEELLAISGIGPGRLRQIREALSALKDGE